MPIKRPLPTEPKATALSLIIQALQERMFLSGRMNPGGLVASKIVGVPPDPASSAETEPKATALALVIQALLHRMLMTGIIDPGDLERFRAFGLDIAADLRSQGDERWGEAVESEIRGFFRALGVEQDTGIG